MEQFIKEAADAAKIARAKNNPDQLSVVAKKVGSNYFLFNKRLQFLPNSPYNLLAAPASDTSKISQSLFLYPEGDSNSHALRHPAQRDAPACQRLVPMGRVELPRLAAYAPEAYVYTNFTTSASGTGGQVYQFQHCGIPAQIELYHGDPSTRFTRSG